jgi:hypothetical protein
MYRNLYGVPNYYRLMFLFNLSWYQTTDPRVWQPPPTPPPPGYFGLKATLVVAKLATVAPTFSLDTPMLPSISFADTI